MSSPEPINDASLIHPDLRRLAEAGQHLEENKRAANTRRAYSSAFAHFVDWASTVGVNPIPAEPAAVYLYLSALVEDDNAAGYAVPTLEKRLAAIAFHHEAEGHPNPTHHVRVRDLMAAIRRTYGRPADKRDPITTAQLHQMVDAIDTSTLTGLRDRAILLFGYAGAFRRSELAAITIDRLTRRGDGYVIMLDHTKDDQEGKGRQVGIPSFPRSPLCPINALDAWLTTAEITHGPIWRRVTRYQTIGTKPLSAGVISTIVKTRAAAVGIPPSRLAGHSLRAGHATTASEAGAPDRTIMRQTGHRSVDTLEGYIRSANVLRDNSARYLGLDQIDGQGPPPL